MLPVLLLLGAAFVLIKGSSAEGEHDVWAPKDEKEPNGPVCVLTDVNVVEPSKNSIEEWREFFGKKGCVQAPPEMPRNFADVGETGDVDKAPVELAKRVYAALYNMTDPGLLLVLGDEVEKAGFQIAANRLRRKAFRLS